MKTIVPIVLTLFVSLNLFSQEDERRLLRGQVLYRNVSVPNENVININSEAATITNEEGQFAIAVKEGDEVAFTAVNYSLSVVKITADILKKNRLVVEVTEKVTQLDEVVVSPENQAKFLEMQNEEFKGYEYEQDRSSQVVNIAMSETDRGMQNGLNFVNIFKALFKSNNKEEAARPKLKVSEVLRYVYDDEFFVVDLKLPQDKIDAFLMYCDTQIPEQELLKKSNEFQLIDFLVNQSIEFRKQLDAEK